MAALSARRPPTWTLAAAFGVLVVYLVTRLRVLHGLPYFLDEGLYAQYSYQGAHSASQLFVSLSIDKPPLQAWLGIPLQWLGANPLVAMRLVSLLAGLLTLWPLYAIGRRAGTNGSGRATGLLAVALATVIPFLLVNDAVGIEEPLVAAAMAGALILVLRYGERPTLMRAAALTAVLTAGVLSKQSAQAALPLVATGLIVFDWQPADRVRRLLRWAAGAAVAVVVPLAAEAAEHTSGYWPAGQVEDRADPLVRSFGAVLRHPFASAPHAWRVFEPAISGYVTLPLVALAILGAVVLWRRQPRLTAVLLLWIVVPASAALVFTIQPFPRHLIYVLPPALVLMAAAFVHGVQLARARLPHAAAGGLSVVAGLALLTPALLFDGRVLARPVTAHYPGLDDSQYVTGIPAGGAWPAVADAIRRDARGFPVVVYVALADPDIVRFLLSGDPAAPGQRFQVVLADQPAATHAQFAIVDQLPFKNPHAIALIGQQGLVPIGRFARPRGGPAITLYGSPSR